MVNCCECGKKLRFFDGYRHPIQGKKTLICKNCFEKISKSIEFYNICLFEGRQNHKNECYFWDVEKKKCKNENYFKNSKDNEKRKHILS
jgi:hypothetical protein